tara:strand:+ start:165 stop:461 length:297 start_codon:yes stop_codon:yes gene_type:complete
MSHMPLLAKQTVPKLQSPRRGPQVLLLCVVTCVVLFLVPQGAYAVLSWNATHAPEEPPPEAVARIIQAATQHQFVEEGLFQDLLATVSYLARRDAGSR